MSGKIGTTTQKVEVKVAKHRLSDKGTVICEVCGEDTGYNKINVFKFHIRPLHHLEPQNYYDQHFKGDEGSCKICQKPTRFIKFSLGYREYCCVKCAQSDPVVREKVADQTPEVKAAALIKRRKTTLERHGAENFSSTQAHRDHIAKTKEVDPEFMTRHLVRSRATSLHKYGVENPFASEEVKKKIKETNLERYGVDNYNKSESHREDYKEKTLKGAEGVQFLGFCKDGSSGKSRYEMKCLKKGHNFIISPATIRRRVSRGTEICNICNPFYSAAQIQLEEFIRSVYTGTMLSNHRATFQGKMEIDVFLPEKRIGIEFNGVYWHSSEVVEPTYHLRKTLACNSKGIRLFHIYEDDWTYKRPILESMLKSLLGTLDTKIHARKCEVREVPPDVAVKFLEENHLQGAVGSQVRLGLFLGDELVSLMTFGEFRFTDKEEGGYELIRFCSKLNTVVVGAASKLFSHFQRKFKPLKVISYADRDRSEGGVYEKLGFKLKSYSKPGFSYVVEGIRKNRFQFRKSVLVAQGFDPSKSELEIMESRGFFRIYNAGNGVYEWLRDK